MIHRIRQWRELPSTEQRELLAYALLLPMIGASLRLLGLRRTQAALHRFTERATCRDADPDILQSAQRSARLAAIAGRHGAVKTTCLRQALAVETVLRHAGLRPVLRLGVDRRGESPDMHAWVELQGHALGQAELRHRPFRTAAGAPNR